MIIGNKTFRLLKSSGHNFPEKKWVVGIEILKRPISMFGTFRPCVEVWCIKVLEFGEYGIIDGKKDIMVGFRKRWISPLSISIHIGIGWRNKVRNLFEL